MKTVVLTWVVYLCVNLVAGTFVILPIDERLLDGAFDTPAGAAVAPVNLLTSKVAQDVIGVWYGIGGGVLLVLFAVFRAQRQVHFSIPAAATLLWMGFAVHFHFAVEANWTWRLSIYHYLGTFAVAVVTQLLAVQSVEPILERMRGFRTGEA